MDHISPAFPRESTLLNNGLIWREISYLDSTTNYREFLPLTDAISVRISKLKVHKNKMPVYATVAIGLLVGIAILGAAWLFA